MLSRAFAAAAAGDATQLGQLIGRQGLDPNSADADGEQLISHIAARLPPMLMPAVLSGYTLLHAAAKNGHTGCVTGLLRCGAVVDSTTRSGESPLSLAAHTGSETCVEVLLRANAATDLADSQGTTAMHWAAYGGHVECVRWLIHAQASTSPIIPHHCSLTLIQ